MPSRIYEVSAPVIEQSHDWTPERLRKLEAVALKVRPDMEAWTLIIDAVSTLRDHSAVQQSGADVIDDLRRRYHRYWNERDGQFECEPDPLCQRAANMMEAMLVRQEAGYRRKVAV